MDDDHSEVARQLAMKGNVSDDDGLNKLVNVGMMRNSNNRNCKEEEGTTQFDAITHPDRMMTIIYSSSSSSMFLVGSRSRYEQNQQDIDSNDARSFQPSASCSPITENAKTTTSITTSTTTSTSSPRTYLVPDPHHDSNKLYGVLRGLPLQQLLTFQLEDMGIDETDIFNNFWTLMNNNGHEQNLVVGSIHDNNVNDDIPTTMMIEARHCIGGAWLDGTISLSSIPQELSSSSSSSSSFSHQQWPDGSRVALAFGNNRKENDALLFANANDDGNNHQHENTSKNDYYYSNTGMSYSILIFPANKVFAYPSSQVSVRDLLIILRDSFDSASDNDNDSIDSLTNNNDKKRRPRLSTMSLLEEANVIIPIIMPRRIQSNTTVMFHG